MLNVEASSSRVLKRKRYEPPEEELSVRIGGKFYHEMKEVHKASKRAKVFETQKVVKRLKDVRKKGEGEKAGEFEAELACLKQVDHIIIGNTAFKSRVLKDHVLRENEDVRASTKKELEDNLLATADTGTTFAKIQSRLLSSKILSSQITASLDSLKVLLNPVLKQPREKTAEPPDHSAAISIQPAKVHKEFNTSAKLTPLMDDDPERQTDSAGDDGWESGSVNEGEPEIDGGWESGSIAGGGTEAEENEVEEPDSDDDELRVTKTKPKTQKAAPKASKGPSSTLQSTFLPSLSVGFVHGSDDSDFSDAEGKAADIPKKNRRGQRARRAIWEKKFGRLANHKKKEAEKNGGHTSTIAGSNAVVSRTLPHLQDPSRPTKPPPKGRNAPQHHQAGLGGRSSSASGANLLELAIKGADRKGDKPLHPSWEAKRRLKEKESAGIVPSQGTKIKFV